MSRNWSRYNDELVRRGEIYIEPGFVDYWEEELDEMNNGKLGKPFEFPESFIEFAATLYTFLNLPYRQLEGFLNVLSRFFPKMDSGDYTTLHKRIKKLELEQPEPERDGGFVVALDATGFKVTDRGEWLREKHGKRRKGWVKAHVAIAVETGELLHEVVTDETVHDNEVLPELVKDLEGMEDCLGDGAYDAHQTFQLLQKLKTGPGPPGIKTRKNSVVTGNTPRDRAVKERKELGYEKWREKHGYGRRWMVETFFSSVKRCFGENIRAKTPETAKKEVERKLQMYSTVAKMAKTT